MLREVRFLCDEKNAEDFGDMLMDAGAMSVTVEDADRDQPDEQPLYGEPGLEPTTLAWKRSRLSVLVAENFDAITAAAIAAKALGIETPQIESDSAVPDENWVKLTQAQFGPTRVSDRLWIVPTWHEPPAPEAINIRLDPGVAFGTGSHPTTHLCLKWLDAHVCSTTDAAPGFWPLPRPSLARKALKAPTLIRRPWNRLPQTQRPTMSPHALFFPMLWLKKPTTSS